MHCPDFSVMYLPKLQEIADITESDPTKFRQYLSPQVYFTFYTWNAPGNDATCRVMARVWESRNILLQTELFVYQ